jgi:F420-non-reducing hydrogenase small subunit
MTPKPRLAMYWAAACGGCDIAVLNLDEALLEAASHLDIVFWPAVMDVKYADVEAMPDGSIDVTLFCGGIRNDENEHLARLLRAKSRILVAFGSCASEGCIPGLANLSTVDAILDTSYAGETTDNPDGIRPVATWMAPEGTLRLPTLSPLLRTLDQVVPVDYVVPGCPPETKRIAEVVHLLIGALEGTAQLPPPGSVLGAGHSTVCDECGRDRNVKHITRFARITDLATLDPALCLLEQGIPCNGPATRDGCGALCPAGARLLSAFASVVDASEPAEIEAILDGLPDPVGQFYRFSLAGSLLRGSRAATRAMRDGEAAAQDDRGAVRQDATPSATPVDGDAAAPSDDSVPATPQPALAAAGGPRR